MKTRILLTIICAAFVSNINAQDLSKYPWLDASKSFEERAQLLCGALTLDEKIQQMGHRTPSINRDGIKVASFNYWNEGLHGVARSGAATSFPISRAMSCTWDLPLVFRCAEATSTEARVYNNQKSKGLTYWCPTINMSRDPRWGRDEENYGEDVFLTSRLAVEYIKGMQGDDEKYFKTIATAKHFACNNYEKGRHSTSSTVTTRDLREYYLPAFEASVREANVQSIMTAYNAINGIPCGANDMLITKILRNEWGFNGYVVSDCDAVDDVWMSNRHHYVNTGAEASAACLKAGMDLNCGETFQNTATDGGFTSAVAKGLCTEADLDKALTRVFAARFATGEFDNSTPWSSFGSDSLENQYHRDLALQASHEAIVLLKNDKMLPLNAESIKKIAVIGPYGNFVQLGGYSGTPTYQKTILDAIAEKMNYDISSDGTVQAENFDAVKGKGGIDNAGIGNIQNGDVFTYNNVDFGLGKSKLSLNHAGRYDDRQITIRIDNPTSGTIIFQKTLDATANNWTTFVTDTYELSDEAKAVTGKHNVYLIFTKLSSATDTNRYIINVDWFKFFNDGDESPVGPGHPVMYAQGCDVAGSKDAALFAEAEAIAAEADVVILALGTDLSVSDESNDRTNLNLPGAQQQLLEAIYAKNKNIVVVLETCSSMTINWAQENIPAILEAWYDGQEQGKAITDVIFGNYNPQGKLTTTWYASLEGVGQLSDNIYDIHATAKVPAGRTYMYHNKTPLYPFGHGLSYTTFEYSNMNTDNASLSKNGTLNVTATIKNTGSRDGAEIVQLYANFNGTGQQADMNRKLIGFARVELKAGESKTITIPVSYEQFSYYDENTNQYKVEGRTTTLELAASSADIRLTKDINTTEGVAKETYISTHIDEFPMVANSRCLGATDRVYNAMGAYVCKASDYDHLPSGVYILNGHKYIRK